MPLIKLATAARRARMGSITAIRRALTAAGVPLVALSPGVFAVEEADLNRFLQHRQEAPAAPPPPRPRPKPSETPGAAGATPNKTAGRKRRQ